MTSVEFGRINRRDPDRSLDLRPFVEDMKALADRGELQAEHGGSTFVAGDLSVDAHETYMSGLIGFAENDVVRSFEGDTRSWLKGEMREVDGAKQATLVPFAVDLREYRRWVCFAVSPRIKAATFRHAFEKTLNSALGALGLLPTEWEVDQVVNLEMLDTWLGVNPDVAKLTRVVRLTNPTRDVDEARKKMRQLGAQKAEETYKPPRAERLRLEDSEVFRSIVEGVEEGDVELRLEARILGGGRERYRSGEHPARTVIPDFGSDHELGIELVLDALRDFSRKRGDVLHGDRELGR